MRRLKGLQVKGHAQHCQAGKGFCLGCRALDTPALRAISSPATDVISVTFLRSCILLPDPLSRGSHHVGHGSSTPRPARCQPQLSSLGHLCVPEGSSGGLGQELSPVTCHSLGRLWLNGLHDPVWGTGQGPWKLHFVSL